MPVSDNQPKKKMATGRNRATSASEWRKSTAQPPLVETPTGKWVRFKRPGMERFLEGGFLPDTLAAAVRKEIASASKRGAKPPTTQSMMGELTKDMDEAAMLEMLASMDRIIVAVMVEPRFVWHRRPKQERKVDGDHVFFTPVLDDKGREVLEDIPEDERRDDVVYTDEMEQVDKNFIFQASVGGSTDLTRFRAEQAVVMDALQASGSVAQASQ